MGLQNSKNIAKKLGVNEYQKTFDLALRIFVYGCIALYFLGFLKFLPDDLSDKIVNLLLGKVGLGK